ncbi:MAG TPA: rRNA maturation RNase YbeY [Pseudomonadota bacterium]|nr:rRNA maturation RNase YbeY [Pseudomonadota bacterium]
MTRAMPAIGVSYGLPRRGLPSAASFRRWVALALGARHAPAELSIRVVAAPEGRRLNREYRGKDYATNVLSFPVELPPGVSLPLLGDIVLCAPVISREAREQGKARSDHYAHLTIHGVLHLLGHQHERPAQARRMERIETQLLETIGIPDPYAGALRP